MWGCVIYVFGTYMWLESQKEREEGEKFKERMVKIFLNLVENI